MSYVIERSIPKLWNHNDEKLYELHFAHNISLVEYFGQINELSFIIDYYEYDSFNEPVYDENNNHNINPVVSLLQNEQLIEFEDEYYVITEKTPIRDSQNKLKIQIMCKGQGIELSKRNIEFLTKRPPQGDLASIQRVIMEIISVESKELDGTVISATNDTINIGSGASSTNDYYNNMFVCILDGTGEHQSKRIIDYNGTTNIITLESNLSIIPDTTSSFRIYNSDWVLGEVDSSLIGGVQSYEFSQASVLDALISVQGIKGGYLQLNSIRNLTTNKLDKTVNYILPNSYNNFEVRNLKNMMGVTHRINTDNLYTRILPEGNDNLVINSVTTENRTDSGTTYETHTLGQPYVSNFSYYLGLGYDLETCERLFTRTYQYIDSVFVDKDDLYEDAKSKLNDKLSIPEIVYTVSLLDLSLDPSGEFDYETFDIGDQIRVVDTDLNINILAVVVKKERNLENPQDITIEISNYDQLFSDIVAEIIKKNNTFASNSSVLGKSVTKVLGVKGSSRNYRTADYFIEEGAKNAQELINRIIDIDFADKAGTLVLLDGIYEINGTITSNSQKIEVLGQGEDTFIKRASGYTGRVVDISDSNNIKFSNLKVDGEIRIQNVPYFGLRNIISSDSNIAGVDISDSPNTTLESVVCNDSAQESITMNDCPNSKVINNESNNAGSQGIEMRDCQGSVVQSNNVDGSGDEGIVLRRDVEGIRLIANNVSNSGDNGVSVEAVAGLNTSKVLIANNTILDSGKHGISVTGSGSLYPVENMKIDTNIVANSGQNANNTYDNIYIGNGVNDIGIQNNTCRKGDGINQSRYGVNIAGGLSNNNVLVSNNDLKDSGVSGSLNDTGTGTDLLGGNRL